MKYTIKQAGFTVIELIVVVTVIAILASIIILSYGGVKNNAYDSAVKSDIRQIADQIELFGLDNNGSYPVTSPTTQLISTELRATKDSYSIETNAFAYCVNNSTTPKNFAVGGVSKSGNAYYYSSVTEKVQLTTAWTSEVSVSTVCTNSNYLKLTSSSGLYGHTYSSSGPGTWAAWIN